jgi:hypothetical protein
VDGTAPTMERFLRFVDWYGSKKGTNARIAYLAAERVAASRDSAVARRYASYVCVCVCRCPWSCRHLRLRVRPHRCPTTPASPCPPLVPRAIVSGCSRVCACGTVRQVRCRRRLAVRDGLPVRAGEGQTVPWRGHRHRPLVPVPRVVLFARDRGNPATVLGPTGSWRCVLSMAVRCRPCRRLGDATLSGCRVTLVCRSATHVGGFGTGRGCRGDTCTSGGKPAPTWRSSSRWRTSSRQR